MAEFTAVVLTALGVERSAVLDHMADVAEEIHPRTGTVYQVGNFQAESGSWRVAVAEIGAGNSGADRTSVV